ncbi:MAG: hypothetical protein IT244_02985, partial [Bacteroidia bacterium]|nr:hypothetical protein [Bacteroidia bacterium]
MVKRYLLILLMLQAFISKATTYYHFTFDANYQYNPGQDSTLKIKWICRDFTGDFADSFFVKSHTKFGKHYAFTNNFAINTIDILVYNSKGVVIGNYNQGSGLYSFRCSGYPLIHPFNGNSCNNFNTFNAGNLCLTGNFIFVKDAVHDFISYKNGHFSDPLGIYCNWEAPNQETQLKLTSPCYFPYATSGKLQWQESNNGIDNWIDIDTGESIYPAKSSYTGGRMYNQNRWYRVVSKGNKVKNISGNYYSEIFGPVHFYLGAKLDSVILKAGTGCNEKPDVWLYYKADSLHKVLGNPRAWLLYKASDTSIEKRWFLDTFSEWPLKLKGRKIKPETGYPVPPEKVQLLKGKYKIMYDFASWRGFDCKLYFDSFTVRDNVIHEFTLTPTILSEEMCFGTKTASIKFKLNSADTFNIKISLDSQQYYDTS